MHTPKIVFRYSWIYDDRWRECVKRSKKKAQKYPSARQVLKYIEIVEGMWRKHEKSILIELSRVTKLKWKSKVIYCYVVGRCVPFSDPLTLPVFGRYPDWFIDNLVHELVHQIFTQDRNLERSEHAWKYVNRKYRKEMHNTRIHIPLHAAHAHIYLKFFSEDRMKRDIRIMRQYPDYRRAWEIVQKEGYQNILREFTRRIK